MISSLYKAVGQLSDPSIRRVLQLSALATLLFYILLYAGLGWAVTHLEFLDQRWADLAGRFLGGVAVFLLTLLLAPSMVLLVVSFFLDGVARAVELRHYPDLPPIRGQGWWEMSWIAFRSVIVTFLLNLLAMPIYLPLMFFGIGAAVYYLLNGYLLSRDYFEMVALRRLEPAQADALRRAHLGRLWMLGSALAFLSSLPLVNLVVPLLGTAAMVHELEALRPSLEI